MVTLVSDLIGIILTYSTENVSILLITLDATLIGNAYRRNNLTWRNKATYE